MQTTNGIETVGMSGPGWRQPITRGANASSRIRRSTGKALSLVMVAALCVPLNGCTTGKVIATPFTAIRDTVDLPLVSMTNFWAWIGRRSGGPSAYAGPSWSIQGGFNFGIGLNLASWICWGISGVFGGVDYIVCRSLYPNFPAGVSPWKKRDQSFGSMLFPCTKALWRKAEKEKAPPPPPDTGPTT